MVTAPPPPTTRRRSGERRTVTLPARLPWQAEVLAGRGRFNVVCIGRRAGKTTLGVDLAGTRATARGLPVGWWSPTYREMLEVWRDMVNMLSPVTSRVSAQDKRLDLVNGGAIEFWSADNPDAGRGRRYSRAIVDEAAMIPRLIDAFNMVIRPTLADYRGDAWFLSTPRGLNDFYTLYSYGADPGRPDWRAWQMPSHVNTAIPGLAGELDAMRAEMPDLVYQQEILAQFVDMAGMVFRAVVDCAVVDAMAGPESGRRYVAGVDLAITGDYTVVSVLDATETPARQVFVDRFNNIPWRLQLDRIADAIGRYGCDVVQVDRTGIGDMPFDELAAAVPDRWRMNGVAFNAGNKQSMVQALALAFEQRRLEVLSDDTSLGRTQRVELMAYEATRRPSGLWSYGAPAGHHDDMVAALMLAYDAASQDRTLRVGRLL